VDSPRNTRKTRKKRAHAGNLPGGRPLDRLRLEFASFALFRFVTVLAIGGEYAAINSAIDELIPARLRGRIDVIVNGTYWVGAAAGAAVTAVLLNSSAIPEWLGWRIAFGLGGIIGGAIVLARRYVPESPRWLLTHLPTVSQEIR
jgi:MFS family permease